MATEQIVQWIATVILAAGGGGAIAWGLFKTFGKAFLDAYFAKSLKAFEHEKNKELARMRIEIESLVQGSLKIQEREFDVLPEAWKKVDEAYGLVQWLTSPMQQYPNVSKMTDAELDEHLATTTFSDSQKQSVRDASTSYGGKKTRDSVYQNLVFWHRLHRVRLAIAELQQYVASKALFLPTDIKQQFDEMIPYLNSATVKMEMGQEHELWDMKSEAWEKFEAQAKPAHQKLEASIKERLLSHSKPTPS